MDLNGKPISFFPALYPFPLSWILAFFSLSLSRHLPQGTEWYTNIPRVMGVVASFNPNYPGCCAKMMQTFLKSYFEMILQGWICAVQCAPLNAAHFDSRWVWLPFININFNKDETPLAPQSVHHCLYHMYMMYTGPGWL